MKFILLNFLRCEIQNILLPPKIDFKLLPCNIGCKRKLEKVDYSCFFHHSINCFQLMNIINFILHSPTILEHNGQNIVPAVMSTPAVKQVADACFISPITSENATSTNNENIQKKAEVKAKKAPNECPVTVSINWTDRTKVNVLKPELSSLGKMLCRGTMKQIARAAWKCEQVRTHLFAEVAKQIHKECIIMCAKGSNKETKKRTDSCLRKTSKESIIAFSFDELINELKERAPLLTLVLKTAALRKLDGEEKWKQSVGVAAAICLRNRSKNMTALQLLISIIIRHSGFVVSKVFHNYLIFIQYK